MTVPGLPGFTFEELQERRLAEVTVAVVDSGVDATHPALAGRVVRAYEVEEGGGGERLVEVPTLMNHDALGHGTAVAGIIAAIAPNARIIDIRVLSGRTVGSGRALLAGFRGAIECGADVVNLSVAGRREFREPLHQLCERCYREGRIVVASARNLPVYDHGQPAELSSCIGVDAGLFENALRVKYLHGRTEAAPSPIEFMGHGQEVKVLEPGGRYCVRNGTSYATPALSGMVALLLGAYGRLRPFEVKTMLKAAGVG